MFALKISVLALILCVLVGSNSSEKLDDSTKELYPDRVPTDLKEEVNVRARRHGLNNGLEIDQNMIENARMIYTGEEAIRTKRMPARIKLPKPKAPKPPTNPKPSTDPKPRQEPLPSGHSYNVPPKTGDITGFPNAEKQKPLGGRARWKDADTGKRYEWDSQHGDLEGYDKSGRHTGSYDHKTGEQTKPAVPGRTIKD